MKAYQLGFLTIRGGSGVLAAVLLVCAILEGVFPEFVGQRLWLNPDAVVARLELWQVVSYVFFPPPTAWSVLVELLIVVGMGSQLEIAWGTPRFWRRIIGLGVGTGIGIVLLSLAIKRLGSISLPGSYMLTTAIWVAVGLERRHQVMNFWSVPLRGYTFALVGLSFALLSALFSSSWVLAVPVLLVGGLTFLVVHERMPGSLLERFGSWRLSRDLKKRSSHLHSIDGGRRNTDSGSDKYLH